MGSRVSSSSTVRIAASAAVPEKDQSKRRSVDENADLAYNRQREREDAANANADRRSATDFERQRQLNAEADTRSRQTAQENREYQTQQDSIAYERQKEMADSGQKRQLELAADRTAQTIRERQEASARSAAARSAVSRSVR